jgi:hypothetical protein
MYSCVHSMEQVKFPTHGWILLLARVLDLFSRRPLLIIMYVVSYVWNGMYGYLNILVLHLSEVETTQQPHPNCFVEKCQHVLATPLPLPFTQHKTQIWVVIIMELFDKNFLMGWQSQHHCWYEVLYMAFICVLTQVESMSARTYLLYVTDKHKN